jgi:putative ABC transport system substrate-binding protein
VATQPDLIFSWGSEVRYFAEAAAGKVPILTFVYDPIAFGLSTSLARPSANITGIVASASEIVGKRFEVLREVRPGVNHVAMLLPRSFWELTQDTPNSRARQIAQQSGLRLTCLCVASPTQEAAFRQTFANLDQDRPDFIFVQDGGETFTYRDLIVGLVNKMRIPALYPVRAFVESGGLISYGYDADDLFRHLAHQMDLVLQGRPVSEVPFYLPVKYELAINLRTAKQIGLEMPLSILTRADEVIE